MRKNAVSIFRNYLDEQKKKHPQAFENFNEEYQEFKLEVLGELISPHPYSSSSTIKNWTNF
jgi:hypothetical protein